MSSMSFPSDLDVYGEIMYDGVTEGSNFNKELLTQCVTTLQESERVEENMVVGEEIVVDKNKRLLNETNRAITEAAMYFEESLQDCNGMTVEYVDSDTTISLTENVIAEKWKCDDINPLLKTKLDNDSCNDIEQDAEEETIATFVTAAGQQLALYAVEDSDEIYAVAVYDESGEPPTNFQFLMKADVERLIGEGAVRTVKKPTQMKKRLLTTQSPVFLHKEFTETGNEIVTYNSLETTSIGSEKYATQQNCEYNYKTISHQNHDDATKIDSMCDEIDYTVTDNKQSDVTYLMMDECPMNIDTSEPQDETQDACEFKDAELIKRSTVQYILLDNDQSDSELTFDEIQETLQNLEMNRKNTSKASVNKKSYKSQNDCSNVRREVLRRESSTKTSTKLSNAVYPIESCAISNAPTSSDNETDDRQRLIDVLTDSSSPREIVQPRSKRSRKQQLTSMNRDDSEIIIQPASMLSEEELTGKKRVKRRRPKLPQDRAINHASKKMKRRKQQIVEVIDLDIDEEEQQAKRNVVEITLDDNKEDGKYSSDKENEIIMVRDSDSDDEEEEGMQQSSGLTKFNSAMRCEHCSRNFRQRRAFDSHLRVCQKSPKNVLRHEERKSKQEQIRKQYACKVCQMKFDVVVALARHARAEHSQRKKHKWRNASQRTQDKSLRLVQQKQTEENEENDKELEEEEEEEELSDDGNTNKRELTILGRMKQKRKLRGTSWQAKKLSCADCGRWFPSSALLDAHSLQHDTKKPERQLRKCHICKKLIRSKLLFLQHLKMHNSPSDKPSTMLRRRLRSRPNVRKIMPLRKRGRPRKL